MSRTEITELRGVEVKLIDGTEITHAYVAHADREKGITIHSMDDDYEIFCLNKETVLNGSQKGKCDARRFWHFVFSKILEMIEYGRVYHIAMRADEANRLTIYDRQADNDNGNHMKCAFK